MALGAGSGWVVQPLPPAPDARRQPPGTEYMYLRQTAAVLIAAGIIRGVSSFVPSGTSPAAAVRLLYLLTDICILLGLIGWFAAIHQAVGAWGFAAFVLGVIGILVIRSSAVRWAYQACYTCFLSVRVARKRRHLQPERHQQ